MLIEMVHSVRRDENTPVNGTISLEKSNKYAEQLILNLVKGVGLP